jgi:hypothetical protein
MESTIVTVNDLKNFSSIGENVDPELLYPHLLIAQQLYLQPVLGDALYNDIVSRFDNSQLTGDTQTLYEQYIIPALAYSSWYSVSPFLNYRTQRAGINTTSSDVLTPVTPEELNIYLSKVENFKQFYLDRLEKYLVTNATLFPLFRQNDVKEMNGSSIYLGYTDNPKGAAYWAPDSTNQDLL